MAKIVKSCQLSVVSCQISVDLRATSSLPNIADALPGAPTAAVWGGLFGVGGLAFASSYSYVTGWTAGKAAAADN